MSQGLKIWEGPKSGGPLHPPSKVAAAAEQELSKRCEVVAAGSSAAECRVDIGWQLYVALLELAE